MMNMLAIFGLGTPEIIAILVIVFLLFGEIGRAHV